MRRPDPAKPDINVTPLVDVVLVLLIIFMVVVPQMEAGAAVTVPGILHPDPKADARHMPITVSLSAAGTLFLEKTAVTPEALIPALREHHRAAPGRRLILKADGAVAYGEVRALFRECQGIGFPGVSLQVGDKRRKER
jgi:biopolymer transport protein ExbD